MPLWGVVPVEATRLVAVADRKTQKIRATCRRLATFLIMHIGKHVCGLFFNSKNDREKE